MTLSQNQESDADLTEPTSLLFLVFLFISGKTDAGMAKCNAQDLSATPSRRWELELHAQGFTHKFLEGKDELFPQMVLKRLFWSRCYSSEGDMPAA